MRVSRVILLLLVLLVVVPVLLWLSRVERKLYSDPQPLPALERSIQEDSAEPINEDGAEASLQFR